MKATPAARRSVGIPPLLFTFTTDQIAAMLSLPEDYIMARYLYYHLRSPGRKERHQMLAINIAPENDPPIWRIQHAEFIRWCKVMGFKLTLMSGTG